MKYSSLFIIFLLSLIQSVYAQQKNIMFEHYSSKQGLSQNTVGTIAQDKKGFMWFGTEEGLNRFDGYNFVTYRNKEGDKNSLSDNLIFSLFVDKDGTLWIGTNSGGLNKYVSDTDQFESYRSFYNHPDSTPIGYINSIVQDRDGFLWVGSYDGLAKFDIAQKKFVTLMNKTKLGAILADNNMISMTIDKENMLWIGTKYSGLFSLDPKTLKTQNYLFESFQPSLANTKINCMMCDKAGTLWLGTVNGLYHFNQKNGEISRYYHIEKDSTSLLTNEVSSLFQDYKGQIWVGQPIGLNLFNPSRNSFFRFRADITSSTSLAENGVRRVFEDRTGQIWIGGETKGISKFNNKVKNFKLYFHELNNRQSLTSNMVRKIYEDTDGKIWIGIFDAGLDILDRKTNTYQHFNHRPSDPNSLNDNRVTSILRDHNNDMWIGTWEGGLDQMQTVNGKSKFIHHIHDDKNPKSISHNVVQDIFEDSWGQLWVGTKRGLDFYDKLTNEFTNYAKDKKNPNSLVNNSIQSGCIKQDKFGNLWVGTWGGLCKIKLSPDTHKPVQFTHFKQDRKNINSLSDNRIISLMFDLSNQLWVGTFGGGLNKMVFDKQGNVVKVTHYNESNGLSSNEIYSIQEDLNRNLWISTNKGLSKFIVKNEKFISYDMFDGLQGNQFFWGAGLKARSGELYFGGVNGMNSFFPDSIKSDLTIPEIVITGFKIFNKNVPIDPNSALKSNISEAKEIVLDYKDKVFSLEFSVLDFAAPDKNRYAYMLEGFDKQWIHSDSKNRIATYTNLDPGKYIFKVRGTNADGIWNDKGTSLIIIITPPFWATWWFRFLMVFFVLSLTTSIIYLKIRSLKVQKKILEQKVAERTAELQESNELLKESHDEVIQQNEEIRQQSEEMMVQRDALAEQNNHILKQNKMITEKNEQISSSIRYALTIQKALLPPDSVFKKRFDFFVVYKPKDIVSGDFYWQMDIPTAENQDISMVAVADCTGHGVPGAIMSMLSVNLLNEYAKKSYEGSPSEILEGLDAGIKLTLRQDSSENRDGLDIIICRITKTTHGEIELCFAGSKTHLLYYNALNNTIDVHETQRRMIGGMKHSKYDDIPFQDMHLSVKQGDSIYLCTDGIADQNNAERKRFGTTNLIESLLSAAKQPMAEQKINIENKLDEWKQSESQRDDITILGLRF